MDISRKIHTKRRVRGRKQAMQQGMQQGMQQSREEERRQVILNMLQFKRRSLLYEGKGKKVFQAADPDQVILFFKDDLTAFQGAKRGSFEGKGEICCNVFCMLFSYLKREGAPVHWIKRLNERESLCEKASMIPLETVVRNKPAGSTAKRLGLKEGAAFQNPPLLEFYLKNDKLDDPFVSEEQIRRIPLIKETASLDPIKEAALFINSRLCPLFLKADLDLADFKMEFGLNSRKELVLADDITPDSCRLWDSKTRKKLDKDRFRLNLGGAAEGYREIERRLSQIPDIQKQKI